MPLTAEGARKEWRYYVERASKMEGGCLKLWESAGRLPRWVYEGFHGRILPTEVCVCHTCDNPWCLNVDHLWEGSHRDNMQDALKKGRHAGERNLEKARAIAHQTASTRAHAAWAPGGNLYKYRKDLK